MLANSRELEAGALARPALADEPQVVQRAVGTLVVSVPSAVQDRGREVREGDRDR
jgi:hypothetical protein